MFLFGIVFGSFFNVCIYRIPKGENIAFPPSHCGKCEKELKWYDLFPIISYIFLKGKCRYCKDKISIRYPIVELLTGVVYVILFYKFGLTIEFIKYVVLISLLIIAAFIDFDTMEVYFSLSLVGLAGGIIFSIVSIIQGALVKDIVVSITIPLIIFGMLIFFTRKIQGMGTGDLEILIIISLYVNCKIIIATIMFSIVMGGIVSIILISKGKRKIHIPFVPFIALGTFIAVMYGNEIISWYLNLFI